MTIDTATATDKPTHYKVICISMYTADIELLDHKVAELKRRGWSRANKSQLIRIALERLDVDGLDVSKIMASRAPSRCRLSRAADEKVDPAPILP